MAAEIPNECQICCEKFNKSTHSMVECEYVDCNYAACKTCMRTYLLSNNLDPHCMNCKKAYSDKFLVNNLNKTFVRKEYKEHRANLLLERELAKMQDTMIYAAAEKEARMADKEVEEIDINIFELENKILLLKHNRVQLVRKAYQLRHPNSKNTVEEHRKFIMPCPVNNCRGFLSSQYKCGVCSKYVCPDCHEVKGLDKDIEHECDKDMVETVKTIKLESKPCPKCGARISKVSGCDQMWCIGCQTAFSWKSGKIETGVVHNPHFFEFQRNNQNNRAQDRTFGQCNAERLPDNYMFRTNLRAFSGYNLPENHKRVYNLIMSILQICNHIENVEIRNRNDYINNATNNIALRVKYLMNDIDKDGLSKQLISIDKERKKSIEIIYILQLVYNIGKDTLWSIMDAPEINIDLLEEAIKHFEEVVSYANQHLSEIKSVYNTKVPIIYKDKHKFTFYK